MYTSNQIWGAPRGDADSILVGNVASIIGSRHTFGQTVDLKVLRNMNNLEREWTNSSGPESGTLALDFESCSKSDSPDLQIGGCSTTSIAIDSNHEMCAARLLEASSSQRVTELRELILEAGRRGNDAVFKKLMTAGGPGLSQALQGSGLLEMLVERAEVLDEPKLPTRTAYVLCISDALKAGVDVDEPSTLDLWQRLEPIVRAHASIDQEWLLVKMAQVAGYPWARQATLDYLARLSGVESGQLRQASSYGLSLFRTLADHLKDFKISWPSTAGPPIA